MRLSLKELSKATGVSKHTIRWYIHDEIVPYARGTGPNAHYDEHHYYAFLAAARLRERGLNRLQVRASIRGADVATLKTLAGLAEPAAPPPVEQPDAPAPPTVEAPPLAIPARDPAETAELVLFAGAHAMDVSPRALRVGLVAALRRMAALDVSIDEALRALG